MNKGSLLLEELLMRGERIKLSEAGYEKRDFSTEDPTSFLNLSS